MKQFHPTTIIKQHKTKLLLGAGIIFILILALTYCSKPQEMQTIEKIKVDSTYSAVRNQMPSAAEVMQLHISSFESKQHNTNQEQANKITQLESQVAQMQKEKQDAESSAKQINDKLAKLDTIKAGASTPVIKAAYKPEKLVMEEDINDKNNYSESIINNSNSSANNLSSNTTSVDNKPVEPAKDAATYIPSNSFVKGVLVSSLSANTGGNANSDPTPVLVRLTDMAQLPNSFRSNIKSCMVGGSGFGDLSTERVKIRLTNLSCILKSGKSLDVPVQGYIAGEDAKAGIRGMVVTHSGTIAAKAALAGFLQGVGQVGQAMGQTQTITPLGGVTSTVAPDQALYAGGGSGISQVGSTLSQYYLNMLQQISPAIEVSAGRHITVVFVQGVELKLPVNQNSNVDNQALPLD